MAAKRSIFQIPAQTRLLQEGSTSTNPSIASFSSSQPFSALAGQAILDNSQVIGTTFRAFVATDSASPLIVATLAETRGVPNATMYCGHRNFGSRDGILITLFCPNVPGNAVVIVTLMQQDAKTYASPVLYTGQ
jgi:hypothetical protein